MAKITMKNIKVLGVKEVLELLKIADPNMPGDSYGTHIENPETMDEAGFSFTIGEGDWAYLKAHENAMERFCSSVMAYFVLEMTNGTQVPYAGTYMNLLDMVSTDKLSKNVKTGILVLAKQYLPYFEDILEWIDSLPYEAPEEAEEEKAEAPADE